MNILTCLTTLEHDPATHAVSRFCDATIPDEIVFVSYLFNWMLREVYNFWIDNIDVTTSVELAMYTLHEDDF